MMAGWVIADNSVGHVDFEIVYVFITLLRYVNRT